MSVDDYCRLCKEYLRIKGTLSNTKQIFESNKVTNERSVDERLTELGLTLSKDKSRSCRICRSCLRLLKRLEDDFAIFRRWQEAEKETSTEASTSTVEEVLPDEAAGDQNICRVRLEELDGAPTPPETPVSVKKVCPNTEPVETTEIACQRDQLKACDGPTSNSEESRLTFMDAQGSPVPRGVSCSTDTSDAFISVYGQMHPKNKNIDLIREKAALLQMKGKYVVNENRLLQLFSHKCPLCGSPVNMEKVIYGVLIILNQQCLQCDYRYQWKSQVDATVPKAEDQHLTGGIEVATETKQEAAIDDTHSSITGVPEIIAVIDDESDPLYKTEESSDQGEIDSDEDWKPVKDCLQPRVLQKETDDETEDDENEEEDGDYPPIAPKHSQLCTECGMFFNKRRPHTCEHKIKPYSCNICGKRCVSEGALNFHSRIHDGNYEHRCKYCHGTFRTRVDKISHEQIHRTEGRPYKCSDCSETFATNKDRKIHLEDHRGPPQLKCHICGIEFVWPLSLQRHLAIHTGLKPYKCSVCQRGFNQPSHLKSHIRLHTGERPYKCQHCDKCFNHNVSLKSHVQRYHSSNSGCERKKKSKKKKTVRDTVDAEGNGDKRGADSGLDNVEEEQDTEEEEQEERINRPKFKRKSTGRPVGRPKSFESGSIVLAVQEEGQHSDSKTRKQQAQKEKRTQCSDEESEEQSDSNATFDSAEEEEERSNKEIKDTVRSRGQPKSCDSDSDFDPEERKKKRCSSQNSGKGSGKRRGRPKKNLVA